MCKYKKRKPTTIQLWQGHTSYPSWMTQQFLPTDLGLHSSLTRPNIIELHSKAQITAFRMIILPNPQNNETVHNLVYFYYLKNSQKTNTTDKILSKKTFWSKSNLTKSTTQHGYLTTDAHPPHQGYKFSTMSLKRWKVILKTVATFNITTVLIDWGY